MKIIDYRALQDRVREHIKGKPYVILSIGSNIDLERLKACRNPLEALVLFGLCEREWQEAVRTINECEWARIDNLDEVPIEGRVKFIDPYAWVQDGHKPYESEVVESPTWLEICQLMNDAINTTGDTHHIYLEDIKVVKVEDGVQIAHLLTGS